MKLLLKILVVLALVVVAACVVVVLFIDSLVRTAVEESGTYALGVETTLEEADLGILSGRVALDGLAVDNPDGFEKEHFLEMGSMACVAPVASVFSDVVEVDLVELSDLTLDIERGSEGTNYGILLENLSRFDSGDEPGDEPDTDAGEAEEEEEAGTSKKFRIDRISLTNISVTVNLLPAGGEVTRQTLTIPKIELTDVGTADDGASATEIVSTLISALLQATIDAGAGTIPADLLQDLSGKLEGIESLAQGKVEEIQKDIEDKIGDGLEDATEKLGGELEKGLDGLFGDKKDE